MKHQFFVALVLLLGGAPFLTPVGAQTAAVNRPEATVAVRLVVKDPNGLLVTGAKVKVLFKKQHNGVLTTDADGAVTANLPAPPQAGGTVGYVFVSRAGFGFNAMYLQAGENTITLFPALELRGRVLDDGGKPLADIPVRLQIAVKQNDDTGGAYILLDSESPDLEVRTDAEGRFILRDMPVGHLIHVTAKHPDYVTSYATMEMAGETLLKMQRSGSVSGLVLDLEGKAVAGVRVRAVEKTDQRALGAHAQTGADGKFTILGIPPGLCTVYANVDGREFVVPALDNIRVQAGKVTPVPVMRGQQGVTVSGVVREAGTLKPIPGVNIGLHGPHRPRRTGNPSGTITDKEGRYKILTMPGANMVYVSGTPGGYLSNTQEQDVVVGQQAVTVNFEIKPAPRLKGMVVNEAGKPIAAPLRVSSWGKPEVAVGADGRFEVQITEDEGIGFTGGKRDGQMWTVVTPKYVKLPFAGPVRVVMKPVQPRKLQGRVVTPEGVGVPQAEVRIEVHSPHGVEGTMGSHVQLVTDAQGRYELNDLYPDQTVNVMVSKADLALRRSGEVKLDGDIWAATDFVLEALQNRAVGVVLTGNGQPAVGANVLAFGRETTTGADGRFTLTDLPNRPIVVLAQSGTELAQAPLTAEPLQLKLQPVTLPGADPDMALRLYDEIITEGAKLPRPSSTANTASRKRMRAGKFGFDQELEGLVAGGRTREYELLGLLEHELEQVLSTGDQATHNERLLRLVKFMPNAEGRMYAALRVEMRHPDKTFRAEIWPHAKAARDEIRTRATGEAQQWWLEVGLWMYAVAAEKHDGREAGAQALREIINYVLKKYPDVPDKVENAHRNTTQAGQLAVGVGFVATGSAELLEQYFNSLDRESGHYVSVVSQAVPIVGKHRGLEAARALLEELRRLRGVKLVSQADFMSQKPAYAFAWAVRRLMPSMAAQYPAESLALIRQIENNDPSMGAEAAGALAFVARVSPAAEAAPLWREAVGSAPLNLAARYAAWAFRQNPALGRELFLSLLPKIPPKADRYAYNWADQVAAFAFHWAAAEPARARMLLETTWAETAGETSWRQLAPVVRAMARVDTARALELATEMGTHSPEWGLNARLKIAEWLELDEAKRRTHRFEDYTEAGFNEGDEA